jgi:hypothetical protein
VVIDLWSLGCGWFGNIFPRQKGAEIERKWSSNSTKVILAPKLVQASFLHSAAKVEQLIRIESKNDKCSTEKPSKVSYG